MKGLIWNCRGLNGSNKKRFLRETILELKIDFIGIQETMKKDFHRNKLSSIYGAQYFFWIWNPARGRSGGILVGISLVSFCVVCHKCEDYFVKLTIQNKN